MVVGGKPIDANAVSSYIGNPRDKIDDLLEASRRFMIGDREYTFNESESIFFITKAIDPRNYHNTPDGCNTCGEKWKKATDLQGSHCHFCGKSSCKVCLTKTRPFKVNDNAPIELNKSGRQVRPRGSICKLCNRKFIIKEMVAGSLDQITSQNQALSTCLAQQEGFKKEMRE
mmetsp:Transcript_24448/g.32754  ORF Transcript_24448/g.32754 Transcript_24448/m.32754 type:complete len:172 (-) Transcript_24448:957-1472(-)